jgi:thiol:disulfide interchange protein DsbA
MRIEKWIAAAALASGFGMAQAQIVEGRDYEKLPQVHQQAQSNKVEVLEFFGYFCIHCKKLDPILRQHVRTFASDTYYRPVHVVWEPNMMTFARLASAVNSTGLKNKANPAIFSAMFDQKINLGDEMQLKKWAASQQIFDGKKLISAYDSFAAKADAEAMQKLTKEYNVEATPMVIVGGKYKVLMKDFNQSMPIIDALVDKVRQERNMPKPAPVKSAGSRGAAAALQANK